MPPLDFEILHRSPEGHARVGRVTTPHGSFDTPAFMPVGTQAAIKGLLPRDVAGTGSQIILGNTYHLMLRPGSSLIAEMGGLHEWMNWDGPILTDSGGYQVFSLSDINHVTDEGVSFKSHLDGSTVDLTPERSIRVQNELGADIIMAFDDCPPAVDQEDGGPHGTGIGSRVRPKGARVELDGPSSFSDSSPPGARLSLSGSRIQQACERSVRWLDKCFDAHQRRQDQALFGIVQGGVELDRRTWCTERVLAHDLPGYAIGGVAVGEGFDQLKSVVEHTAVMLPETKPRYLMGVGYERDLLVAVRSGVDMFDCVLPTRNGRNSCAFTPGGQIRLKNAAYARDPSPIDPGCDCLACRGPSLRETVDPHVVSGPPGSSPGVSSSPFSRSYLRHLFLAGEMLGPILVSIHNIRHFQRYLLDIRTAIVHNDWSSITRKWPTSRPPEA